MASSCGDDFDDREGGHCPVVAFENDDTNNHDDVPIVVVDDGDDQYTFEDPYMRLIEEEERWRKSSPQGSLFERNFVRPAKHHPQVFASFTSILSLGGLLAICISALRTLKRHKALLSNQAALDDDYGTDGAANNNGLVSSSTSSPAVVKPKKKDSTPSSPLSSEMDEHFPTWLTTWDSGVPADRGGGGGGSNATSTTETLQMAPHDLPLWATAPFYFTATGAAVGFILEFTLMFLLWEPYNLTLNPVVAAIGNLRNMIYAFSLNSGTFLTFCMTRPEFNVEERMKPGSYRYVTYVMMVLSGTTCIVAYYGIEMWIPLYVAASLILQLYWTNGWRMTIYMLLIVSLPWTLASVRSLVFDDAPGPNEYVEMYPILHIAFPLFVNLYLSFRFITTQYLARRSLGLATLFHLSASLIDLGTPLNSTGFHILATAMMFCAYKALDFRLIEEGAYGAQVARAISPRGRHARAKILASFLVGYVPVRIFAPHTFYALRSTVAYVVWTSVYFGLLHRPFLRDNPFRLSDVYNVGPPKRLKLNAFTEQHSEYMPRQWNVQTVQFENEEYPRTFKVFQQAVEFVSAGFTVVTTAGQVFPLADIEVPIQYKPRLKPTEDGRDALPYRVFRAWPGFLEQAKQFQEVPDPVMEAYKDGRLFGHLCQYGIGNSFLRLAQETDTYPYYRLVDEPMNATSGGGLVVDFRHLERYETKDDYYKYGGIAFLRVREKANTSTGQVKKRLDVVWVVGTGSLAKVYKNKYDGSYYRISHVLVSSLYFEVIAGKHLMELHMRYELLWASVHNVFDYGLNRNQPETSKGTQLMFHPFRLILYPHMFCSAMATELLVVHLVQQVAVFSQIFAVKYHALLDYMTDVSSNFEYASDENWDYRAKVDSYFQATSNSSSSSSSTGAGKVEFRSQFDWEQRYRTIWDKYAASMVNTIYENNDQARNDVSLRRLNTTLSTVYQPNGLPKRYDDFETKKGLIRFLSDTIHHLVIRHYIYGTTIVESGALDARINVAQLPKDLKPPAVGEYRAFAFILMATAYPFFCKLLQDQGHAQTTKRKLSDIFTDASEEALLLWLDNDDEHPHRNRRNRRSPPLSSRMKNIFNTMQSDLRSLDDEWSFHRRSSDPKSADPVYMFGVAPPDKLFTGPCS